jgi:hypothetical protein
MSSQQSTALESLVAMGFEEDESNAVRPPPRPSHAPSQSTEKIGVRTQVQPRLEFGPGTSNGCTHTLRYSRLCTHTAILYPSPTPTLYEQALTSTGGSINQTLDQVSDVLCSASFSRFVCGADACVRACVRGTECVGTHPCARVRTVR